MGNHTTKERAYGPQTLPAQKDSIVNKVTVVCGLCGGTATDLHPCEGCGEEGRVSAPKEHIELLAAMRDAVKEAGGESAPVAFIAKAAGTDEPTVDVVLHDLSESLMVVQDYETGKWWITPPGLAVSGGNL